MFLPGNILASIFGSENTPFLAWFVITLFFLSFCVQSYTVFTEFYFYLHFVGKKILSFHCDLYLPCFSCVFILFVSCVNGHRYCVLKIMWCYVVAILTMKLPCLYLAVFSRENSQTLVSVVYPVFKKHRSILCFPLVSKNQEMALESENYFQICLFELIIKMQL